VLNITLKAGLVSLGIAAIASLSACQIDETVPVTPSPTLAAAKTMPPATAVAHVYPSGPYDETPITPRETAGASIQD
jgi:hypothetical protein